MRNVSPFIVVERCNETLEQYQSIFGGEIKILKEHDGNVLQAELHVGDCLIHFADAAMANPSAKGDYVKIMVDFESEEEIRKSYDGLIVGGQIAAELQETPFGALLASITDRNGIGWILKYIKS